MAFTLCFLMFITASASEPDPLATCRTGLEDIRAYLDHIYPPWRKLVEEIESDEIRQEAETAVIGQAEMDLVCSQEAIEFFMVIKDNAGVLDEAIGSTTTKILLFNEYLHVQNMAFLAVSRADDKRLDELEPHFQDVMRKYRLAMGIPPEVEATYKDLSLVETVKLVHNAVGKPTVLDILRTAIRRNPDHARLLAHASIYLDTIEAGAMTIDPSLVAAIQAVRSKTWSHITFRSQEARTLFQETHARIARKQDETTPIYIFPQRYLRLLATTENHDVPSEDELVNLAIKQGLDPVTILSVCGAPTLDGKEHLYVATGSKLILDRETYADEIARDIYRKRLWGIAGVDPSSYSAQVGLGMILSYGGWYFYKSGVPHETKDEFLDTSCSTYLVTEAARISEYLQAREPFSISLAAVLTASESGKDEPDRVKDIKSMLSLHITAINAMTEKIHGKSPTVDRMHRRYVVMHQQRLAPLDPDLSSKLMVIPAEVKAAPSQ